MTLDIQNTKWAPFVRPATKADKEAVESLLKDSYYSLLAKDYAPDFLAKALPGMTQARDELLECGTWYVLEDPDDRSTLIGCGGFTFDQPRGCGGGFDFQKPLMVEGGEKVPHLRHFGTKSDKIGMGVGKAIWQRTWEDLGKLSPEGYKTKLEVLSTLTAVPFYASIGFVKVKEVEVALQEDCNFPSVLMRRDPSQLTT